MFVDKKHRSFFIILVYRLFKSYEFDWDHVQILEIYESFLIKKNFFELLHIKKQIKKLSK